MRGSCAAESQEVSPLLSVLTGVTFDVTGPGEEHCESLATERVVWDRRDKVPGDVPPPMPDCVRVGFADQDRITPRLFLTIALQTVDELVKSEDTLFNPDQIHLLSHAIRPTVRVDFERDTQYGGCKTAADEAERVRKAQEVLVQLAEAGKLTEGDSITPLKTSMASMSELREALFKTYKALERSGDYKSFFWKGICRPMLGMSWEDKVAVKKYGRDGVGNFVCDRCKPGEVMSLPVPSKVITKVLSRHPDMKHFIPDDHRLPLKDWVVPGPDGKVYTPGDQWPPQETVKGTWKEVTEMSADELQCKAQKEDLELTNIPWEKTWHGVTVSREQMTDQMDKNISRWRVANLDDLVKSYRLSEDIVCQLKKDASEMREACDKLVPYGMGCVRHYICSYAQTYVLLEFTDGGNVSKLRLVTVPFAFVRGTSMGRDAASRREAAFWNQVRADAGTADDTDYFSYSAVKDGVAGTSVQ
ncbi:hypothetical protein GNI_174220 [Gregarina niphandrodes]|uniref:Uncharacterized protein n=1 Tax=Gregarina niphandrodes TaxID=110365 RepID=A0A023AXL8_GRENI|nr:hypothetical protein GNI_174220 [Gregarina niphandrodes]EZG43391.1 hypothetical protein GNI_174220 [Gregarina niphandrodes]|eukprot:XP_011133379.1 hypothetical protein GNI_174220 [Gregarina niphandrodes]